MFLTTNGGQLWVQETVDPSILSVIGLWFYNSSLGWVVGARDSSGHLISPIFTTTDGGVHWQPINRDTATITFSAIEFVTSLKGWLVGSKLYSDGTGQGYLFYTTDGGVSWALRDSSTSTAYWDISFADSLCGFLAAGNPGMGQSSGFLKKTTDGGAIWQAQSWGFDMFRRIHCLDQNHVWRSEYYQFDPNPPAWSISKTNNGGATWQSVLSGGINANYSPPVVVVDTLKALVLGFDTLYGTKDGGKNWARQVPPGFKQAICFTDSLNGWIVGQNGLILHTTDGGLGVFATTRELSHQNIPFTIHPNPMRSRTYITSNLFPASIEIYDISGRLIRKLRDTGQEPRKDCVVWDGRNQEGQLVSSAVYIVCLTNGNTRRSQRLAVIR